tara:strand:- start:139 stop:567 length:429 start_codon:yes stop_codon:yes gene_type:complete
MDKDSSGRLSWENYALKLAKTASERSEDPYVKVGACALGWSHEVLGLGYNGLMSGKDVEPSFWEDRDSRRPYMIHAEVNCLAGVERNKCKVLAVTLLPCAYCATLIAAHEIRHVVYGDTYDRDTKALEIFDFYGIKLLKLDL